MASRVMLGGVILVVERVVVDAVSAEGEVTDNVAPASVVEVL